MSSHPVEEPLAAQPVTIEFNDPLDEDLFCLFCGYNLRGLSGNPVRCPECGKHNDVRQITVPAGMIRAALRKMETAPAVCVACTTVLIALAFLASIGEPRLLVFVGPVALIAWSIAYRQTEAVCKNRPGWRRIVVDFHAVTLLCTSFLPLLIMGLILSSHPFYVVSEEAALLGALLLAVPMFVAGLIIYSRTRSRLHEMQREEAIRIARETLRRVMQKPRH
jgi:hypothetical protein